jgi:hypothetical protein
MGSTRSFNPVKLFVGILASDRQYLERLEERLTTEYGAVDHHSPVMPCEPAEYCVFLSFERLIDADRLPEIKLQTNQLEAEITATQSAVKRPLNLDPGYLEHAKVILASTKNFYHRIYLGDGIFGEVTMHFKNNTYQFFPWTYPDYQSRDFQQFFLRMRQIYRSQLRTMCILDQNPDQNR